MYVTFKKRVLCDLHNLQSRMKDNLDHGINVINGIKASVDRMVIEVEKDVAKEAEQARKLWNKPGVRVALVVLAGIVLLGLGAALGNAT